MPPYFFVQWAERTRVLIAFVSVGHHRITSFLQKRYPRGFVAEGHEDNFGKAAFWGAEAVVTLDGKWYYYICRVHHSLAIFEVQADGLLVAAGRQDLAPKSNPRNLTMDVSGRHVLVASQDADCVEVFRIDPANGSLTRTDTAAANCAADVAVV
jgi:6-phosphogluconolactonase